MGGVAILLLLFIFGAWWSGSAGWGVALARPFWFIGGRISAGFNSLFAAYAEKGKLVAENEALLNRLSDLEIALRRQDYLLAENESLRQSLGLPQPTSQKIVAQVINNPQYNSFDTFLIDTGANYNSAEHLAVGDLVGLGGSLALGRVISIESKVTKIKLFSAPGSELPAVLGPAAAPIKLIGRGLGNFVAEVPRGLKVNIGDQALFNNYSTNWLVAEVGAVEGDEAETTQRILLRIPVNLAQLNYVEVHHY